MKIYLAGKITGDPEYREKFAAAVQQVYRLKPGCQILNPATLPEGMAPADYMQLCLQMLFTADAVAFLPDWCTSAGAGIEYQLCAYIGKTRIMLEDLEHLAAQEDLEAEL